MQYSKAQSCSGALFATHQTFVVENVAVGVQQLSMKVPRLLSESQSRAPQLKAADVLLEVLFPT